MWESQRPPKLLKQVNQGIPPPHALVKMAPPKESSPVWVRALKKQQEWENKVTGFLFKAQPVHELYSETFCRKNFWM